jgi:hypothetical protein
MVKHSNEDLRIYYNFAKIIRGCKQKKMKKDFGKESWKQAKIAKTYSLARTTKTKIETYDIHWW